MKEIKICMISTTGGHLSQLLQLRGVFEKYEHYFVTVRSKYSEQALKDEKVFYIKQHLRNPLNFIRNFFESLNILVSEKPDVVITTGAGDALSTCFFAKLMNKKVIFIETFARVTAPSFFGLFAHPISDLTIVQWDSLLKIYKGSVYGGPLYRILPPQHLSKEGPMNTFIIVGTHTLSFDRLLKALDDIVRKGLFQGRILAQIGHSRYEPTSYEWFRFEDPLSFIQHIKESDLIITHDGSNAISNALSEGKMTIVVPRLKRFKEVSYNNKYDLARALEKERLVILVRDIKDLENAIIDSRDFIPTTSIRESNVVRIVNNYLSEIG